MSHFTSVSHLYTYLDTNVWHRQLTMFNNTSEKPGQLRHRTGVVKSASKQKNTVQTRKVLYKVGYNWNKGGRLKELRIRHLARKFLKIWKQKTFGRVLSQKAKFHYKDTTLKRIFDTWKDVWWTSRREWSLMLRAECHHKYFLCNQLLQSWRHFVILQRMKKIKTQNAQAFADKQRLRHAGKCWENYTEVRRIKKRNLATALELYKCSTLKSTWTKWKHQLQRIQYLYVMQDEVLKQKRTSTQRKVLLHWRDLSTLSYHERLNELKASHHNTTRLRRKAFKQWMFYVSCRNTICRSAVVAQKTFRLRLLRVYWTKWSKALYEKWSEEVTLEAAGHLAVRICQRRVVNRWKAYMKLCHKKTDNIQKAQEHNRHTLLKMTFGGLSRNVKLNKSKRLNYSMASQHHHQTVVGTFWRLWRDRLEEVEDRSFQYLTEKADTFYSVSLSRACFRFWRERLSQLRHMRTLEKQADTMFADRILPVCFHSWHNWTVQETIQEQRQVQAEEFNRRHQYSWVFYTWWELSEKHKQRKMAEETAIYHEEQKKMQKAWILWRKRTEMRMKEKHKMDISKHLYQQRLVQNTMTQWKENTAELRYRRSRELQAYLQGDLCILRWTVDKWKKFVLKQKVKKQKAEEMLLYHEKQILKHFFATWKKHHLQMQSVYVKAEELYKQQTLKSLRRVLEMWQENGADSAKFRIKKQMAQNHHRHVLHLKMFSAWRERTVFAVTKHHQQMAALSHARESIKKGKLTYLFNKWRLQTKTCQMVRLHMQRAERYHDTSVLTKTFRCWEDHHRHFQNNKVMKRQASLLLRLKIWQTYFDQWKIKLQHRRRERRLTESALWHWSLSLQAKVLSAWRVYAAEQHREREEVAKAAQFYRDNLLREGVSRILTYAAQMDDLTTSLTQHTQEQRARRLQRVVRRCALKWKLPCESQAEEDHALMERLYTRTPRRQPRCSEELLKSPRTVILGSFTEASQSQSLSFDVAASLPAESTPNQTLLLPPSAFMTAITPEEPSFEQSGQPVINSRDPVIELTNELLGIKQDMTLYQQDKKQLRAWCMLRDVLETWLQTSGQDNHAETDSVSKELEELKNCIDKLTTKLSEQKPTIVRHVERIQHLQASCGTNAK
uniref:Sfi1 spindle body domain-containing protein n=1 Tax=Knipowitschia caucasica TaxID=637954 RepID=A0AAV2M7X4_KNICA